MRLIYITTCQEHCCHCEAMSIIHAPHHTHNYCNVKNYLLICPLLSHCYIGQNFLVGYDIKQNICEIQYCITQEWIQMPTVYYTVTECTTAVYVLLD